jgi:ubiquinone/menaquinone biosynthesis C-methylase UbiE
MEVEKRWVSEVSMSLSQRLFAFWYDKLNYAVEWRLTDYRRRTAGRATGDVLEIGGGTGVNLRFYPHNIDLTMVEPNPHMVPQLQRRAKKHNIELTIVPDYGEALSFDDESFDTVVTTLVLCTVKDLDKVVSEARRVLRPGGSFYFYEHVQSHNERRQKWENFFNPFWKWATTGCNLNRDIEGAIRRGGFTEVDVDEFDLSFKGVPLTLPNIVGVARV